MDGLGARCAVLEAQGVFKSAPGGADGHCMGFSAKSILAALMLAGRACVVFGGDGMLSDTGCALGVPVQAGDLLAGIPAPECPPSPELRAALMRQRVGEAFDRALGHPESLDLQWDLVPGTTAAMGQFRRIVVATRGGALGLLPVGATLIEFLEVQLDLGELESRGVVHLSGLGGTRPRARFRVDVGAIDLQSMFQSRQKIIGIQNPVVTIQNGHVELAGRSRSVPGGQFRTRGSFRPGPGARVIYEPSHLWVGALRVPTGLVASTARKLNPVLDLGQLPAWAGTEARLGRIEVTDGVLLLESAPPPGPALLSRVIPEP